MPIQNKLELGLSGRKTIKGCNFKVDLNERKDYKATSPKWTIASEIVFKDEGRNWCALSK